MPDFEIKNAREKDIEILTSMKMVTMIDDEMDRILSYNEKKKIKSDIVTNINKLYKQYKVIYVGSKIAGSYLVIDYLDGKIIDQLYIFEEYRRLGIASKVVKSIKEESYKLYAWLNKSNDGALKFFRSLGFATHEENGRTLILKSDSIETSVLSTLKDISLGYRDRNGNKYILLRGDFRKNYYLQSPSELLESKIGLSIDQVELERELLGKLGLVLRTYYIVYSDLDNEISHAFLVYKDNGKYYWIENAWYKYKGIHEYDSQNELLADVGDKFIKLIDKGDINKIKLYSYDKVRYGINFNTFVSEVINGKRVKI